MNGMSLYLYKENQQLGPYDDSVVVEGLRSGRLAPTDLACREGMGGWQSLTTLFPLEAQPLQTQLQLREPVLLKQPKCLVCGYVGPFQKPPIIYPRDLIISLVLFCLFGAGLVWFTISILQKKPKSCPKCKVLGQFTYDY